MKTAHHLTIVTLQLAVSSLSAATLYVGPGGYSTIQWAVKAARPGDTVVVTNGVYLGLVAVTKPLTLDIVSTVLRAGCRAARFTTARWVATEPIGRVAERVTARSTTAP